MPTLCAGTSNARSSGAIPEHRLSRGPRSEGVTLEGVVDRLVADRQGADPPTGDRCDCDPRRRSGYRRCLGGLRRGRRSGCRASPQWKDPLHRERGPSRQRPPSPRASGGGDGRPGEHRDRQDVRRGKAAEQQAGHRPMVSGRGARAHPSYCLGWSSSPIGSAGSRPLRPGTI